MKDRKQFSWFSAAAKTVVLAMAVLPAVTFIARAQAPQALSQPIALSSILDWLAKAKRDPVRFPIIGLAKRIEKQGLDFVPNPEDLTAIKEAGGPDFLLAAVDKAEKPAPPGPREGTPPPPPKKKEGRLTVICEPVDCSVSINDIHIGVTNHGELSRAWQEGEIRVAVRKDDFEADRNGAAAVIAEDKPARVEFHLKPSRASLERAGAELFQLMLAALGGPEGLKNASALKGSGAINVFSTRTTPWSAQVLIKGDKARFSVKRTGQNYEIGFTDSPRWKPEPKGQEPQDLGDALVWLQDYEFARIMEKLRAPEFKMVVTRLKAKEGESEVLRAEGSPATYIITLDSANRPKEIRIESAGLNNGRKVLFSDYLDKGKSHYPKDTQVILPGGGPRGVQLQFDTLELNPSDVRDADFDVSKKRKGLWSK
ncbi:MAG: hypothetical protein IT167_27060 [Bryobacterales bacterium]|nr:hypothetical protein [Bryobacterales bacterium]